MAISLSANFLRLEPVRREEIVRRIHQEVRQLSSTLTRRTSAAPHAVWLSELLRRLHVLRKFSAALECTPEGFQLKGAAKFNPRCGA